MLVFTAERLSFALRSSAVASVSLSVVLDNKRTGIHLKKSRGGGGREQRSKI